MTRDTYLPSLPRSRAWYLQGTWPEPPAVADVCEEFGLHAYWTRAQLVREITTDVPTTRGKVALEVCEALVARGLAPEEWLDRLYPDSHPSQPPGSERIRIHPDAFPTLAQDPQRMLAVEALVKARVGAWDVPIIWAAPPCIEVFRTRSITQTEPDDGGGPWLAVRNVAAPGLTTVFWSSLPQASYIHDPKSLAWVGRDARKFLKYYREAFQELAPVFDSGVMPWICAQGILRVVLVCPHPMVGAVNVALPRGRNPAP
jgi:hypothetical protein